MKNRDAKKELILEASFRLFTERGFQSTKIADIAAAVNMGKSTFYEYFRSKEEIFSELLHSEINQNYLKGWDEITASSLSVRSKLEKMLLYDISYMEERGNFLQLLHDIIQTKQVCSELLSAENLMDIINVRHEYVRRVIHEGIDSGQLKAVDAELILIIVTGSFEVFLAARFRFIPWMEYNPNPTAFLALLFDGLS